MVHPPQQLARPSGDRLQPGRPGSPPQDCPPAHICLRSHFSQRKGLIIHPHGGNGSHLPAGQPTGTRDGRPRELGVGDLRGPPCWPGSAQSPGPRETQQPGAHSRCLGCPCLLAPVPARGRRVSDFRAGRRREFQFTRKLFPDSEKL